MIPHNKPCLNKKDAKKAYNTVLSGWIAYGKESKKVEKKLSSIILNSKKNRSIVCSSGTAALYLALYALGIKQGDEIIVSTYTCTAVLNSIEYIGAKAILVDIDKDSLNLDINIVKKKISNKTKAIIVVHTYGIACELDQFKELNISIIEDCSQSLGSTFLDGSQTGSKGDIAIFSFYATKLVTGGYGGAVVSKKRKYIKKIKEYIEFDQPDIYYPKFNFLLSDINASVIFSQLNRLEYFLKQRKNIAQNYIQVLNKRYLHYVNIQNQNYYRFVLLMKDNKELKKCIKLFLQNGIKTINPLTKNELLHRYINKNKKNFPVSEYISKRLLSIPIYPCLKDTQIEKIKNILGKLP